MAVKVERRDGSAARSVLVAMIFSRAVLGPIAARWQTGLFASKWENLVGQWCVDHYRTYARPPGGGIEHYFTSWANKTRDRETIELVETFLIGLADDLEKLTRDTTPDHLLDLAGELFEGVHLTDVANRVLAAVGTGDVKKARGFVEASRKVEIGLGAGIDVLAAEAEMVNAFGSTGEAVVKYPDALERFFEGALCRDSFVGFMAPEKRGKSWFLQDLAVRAVEQDRKVAYFECGDHSQPQVLRRLACRLSGNPLKDYSGKGEGYPYPTVLERCLDGDSETMPVVDHEYRHRGPLTKDEAVVAIKDWSDRYAPDRFKLSCHPNTTISVTGIEAILETWGRDDWHPDVVVIDYADILAPQHERENRRDEINDTWKALRGLSQKQHCLVVTATQTDADSYDERVLKKHNFSEDKRKYAHVTGMVGINQTFNEKKKGLFRLNWVALRDLDFEETKCVWLASCLAVGNPCVLSTF